MKSLPLLGGLAFGLAIFAPALSLRAQRPLPAPIGSTFFDWDALRVKTTLIGFSRTGISAPTPTLANFEFHITTLNPGRISHPVHHHPQEELILLREGTLESSINGHQARIGAGSILFFAAHDVHNVTNVGDKPATYYAINFYTAATAKVRNQPVAEWAPPELFHSAVLDWSKMVAKPSPTGFRRELVDSPTATFADLKIHVSTVNPGSPASAAHRHPWVEFMVVQDGAVDATVDGVTHRIGPGSAVLIASNSMQSYKNPGSLPATYFVFAVSSALTPKPSGG